MPKHRRMFSITSLRSSRWYWVIWPSLAEIQSSPQPLLILGQGYASSKASAVASAVELAGKSAHQVPGRYAKDYHHSNASINHHRTGHPSPNYSHPYPVQECLYQDVYEPLAAQWNSVPHRIVRKTRQYIYVEQNPYPPGDQLARWLDPGRPTYRLHRQSLEQEGFALLPATVHVAETEDPMFFSYERLRAHENRLHLCLDNLGIPYPCTAADLSQAYRRATINAHPDGGGTLDQFLALQASFQQAQQLCQLLTQDTVPVTTAVPKPD